MKRSSLPLLGAAMMLSASACLGHESLSVDEHDVSVATQALAAMNGRWPNNTVPVCFNGGSALVKRQIRDQLYGSWSTAADVEFDGWGDCAVAPNGVVQITPNDGLTSSSDHYGFNTANEPYKVALNTSSTVNATFGATTYPFARGAPTVHELGHMLGFIHETDRQNWTGFGAVNATPGVCAPGSVFPADGLGTPANEYRSIMAWSYCMTNHPGVLSRWDMVGARKRYGTRADNVISAGSTLYARKRSLAGDGFIFRYTGFGWEFIGGSGSQFLMVGSTLYALNTDSSGVYRYNNSPNNWTRVGDGARTVLRCGASLCAENEDGVLYRYSGSGTAWNQIGGAAAMYASTSGNVYRLTIDRQSVEEYSGSGTAWNAIGGPAGNVYATSTAVFATQPETGEIFRYNGSGSSWSVVGGPGRHFVGVGSTLYGLTPDRGWVFRYTGIGQDWTPAGGAADWIYGGSSQLYATHPSNKNIYRYNGSGLSWSFVGQP